jgi:hypothetical protein
MREVSDDFNRAVINGRFVARVDCTLTSGRSVTFLPQDIMQGGISVNSATSNSGSFGIGCAVIGRCTIRLRNERRQLNGLNLSGARVEPYIGAIVGGDGEQAEVEWLKLGTYWVEPFDIYDDIVSLTCLDALSKMEVPCSSTGEDVTLGDLAYELCDDCGLTLMTETFPHSDYAINELPDLSGKSCLEVLSYVAQVAGCYVTVDEDGGVYLVAPAPSSVGEDGQDGLAVAGDGLPLPLAHRSPSLSTFGHIRHPGSSSQMRVASGCAP